VRFCCPHCDKAYFGTGASGHLVPRSFACLGCGREIDMDEMILRPAEELGERRAERGRMPWLERQGTSAIKAWLATIGMALTRPTDLMAGMPVGTSIQSAWLFMFVTNVIFRIPGVIFAIVTLTTMMAAMSGSALPRGATRQIVAQALGGQGAALAAIAAMPVLWIIVTHGILRASGKLEHGLARTWQAICYSTGANCATAIPCLSSCGALVGAIWWSVSATAMVHAGHGVSAGRAVFATLTGGAVAAVAAIAGFAGLYWSLGMFGPMGGLASAPGDAALLAQAIVADAAQRGGEGPPHAAMLLPRGGSSSWDFVALDASGDPENVPFGDGTLADLDQLEPGRRSSAIAAVASSMPAGVVAHRLGDYVFTYHGADLSSADPRLWIVVMMPDPATSGPFPPRRQIHIGLADGTARSVAIEMLPAELRGQNELRRSQGLPPLPDLTTVTHDAPAVEPP
jgi:hypothetical protein